MAKILIVDDSSTEVHVFTRMLENHRHQVLIAENGAQGLEVAKRERPDLILMDIVMPEMDGFRATRLLNKAPETAHIPVIMISTKSQETDKIWAKRQGAQDYIIKPIEEQELIKKITPYLQAK
jgi:twitching motility two-component system response regulator PilH